TKGIGNFPVLLRRRQDKRTPPGFYPAARPAGPRKDPSGGRFLLGATEGFRRAKIGGFASFMRVPNFCQAGLAILNIDSVKGFIKRPRIERSSARSAKFLARAERFNVNNSLLLR